MRRRFPCDKGHTLFTNNSSKKREKKQFAGNKYEERKGENKTYYTTLSAIPERSASLRLTLFTFAFNLLS